MRLAPAYPLHSTRLTLRPLEERDVDALFAYRSLPDVCRWVPFEPMTAAEITERLRGPYRRSTIEREGDAIVLGAVRSDTQQLVGDLMLRWLSREHRCGEVGYVFNPDHGGLGYATEAVHRVLHLGFDEFAFHRVVARVDARNIASAKLATRVGLRQEAHLVKNEWFKGEWGDELDFAILEEEWRAQSHLGCIAEPRSHSGKTGNAPPAEG